jgi:hypothetical protein
MEVVCLGAAHAEAMKHLLRNEVSIGTESIRKPCNGDIVKMKNIQCDPTKKLHVKTKWSDIVAGRSMGRRRKDSTSNKILKSNISSSSTDEQWKTMKRGHKKPPTVNHASYYRIPIIINQYELLRNRGKYEQIAHELMKTRAGDKK